MSRPIGLPFFIVVLFHFIVSFDGVENATLLYQNNPFLQSVVKPVSTDESNLNHSRIPGENSTHEPIFTIEPPEILYGNKLNRFCLQPKGQFPSATCNNYVNCWDGTAIEQTCPPGLLFNPVKLYCDYQENVDCKGKFISEQTHLPGAADLESSHIFDFSTESSRSQKIQESNMSLRKLCAKATGVFPGSTCEKFVNCWNGNAVEQDCPAGLHFSLEGFCDFPEKVGCNGHKKEIVSERNGDCPLEFGTFRNRSNCGEYYTCAYNKIAAKFQCPEGFSFSDILGICDYSYRVDCSKEPQIFQRLHIKTALDSLLPSNAFANPDIIQPTEIGDIRCSTPYGFSRDRTNCSIYYVCRDGAVSSTHVCPQGYSFSAQLDRCDYSEKVDCSFMPLTPYNFKNYQLFLSNIPSDVLRQIQNCQPGNIFRLNLECTSVCRCYPGFAEIIQCPEGLAYDAESDKCVPTELVRC